MTNIMVNQLLTLFSSPLPSLKNGGWKLQISNHRFVFLVTAPI